MGVPCVDGGWMVDGVVGGSGIGMCMWYGVRVVVGGCGCPCMVSGWVHRLWPLCEVCGGLRVCGVWCVGVWVCGQVRVGRCVRVCGGVRVGDAW